MCPSRDGTGLSERTSVVACVVLAVLVAGVFVLRGLGSTALVSWDEGLYAKIALDMMRAGEWLVYPTDGPPASATTFKPPLGFYAEIASFSLFGPSEYAARLPAALSFVLLVAAVAVFCVRTLDRRAAVLAVVFLVTSKRLLSDHFARHGAMDAPLALFLTLTITGLWAGDTTARRRRASVAYAAALLVKGVAALQIVPVVAIWLSSVRAWRRLPRVGASLALAAVPLGAWLVVRELYAPGFVSVMLGRDLVARVQETVGTTAYDPFIYLRMLTHDFARIGVVLLVLVAVAFRVPSLSATMREPTRCRELLILLVAWTAVPIALFSMARTQHTWYALPSYVPATVLAAWCASALIGEIAERWRSPRTRGALVVALLVLVTLAVGGRTTWRLFRTTSAEPYSVELRRLVERLRAESPRLVLFPTWDAPALRFYLTRDRVAYAVTDDPARLEAMVADGFAVASTEAHEPAIRAALGARAYQTFAGPASRLVAFRADGYAP